MDFQNFEEAKMTSGNEKERNRRTALSYRGQRN